MDKEILLLMGIGAAGKSTLVEDYVQQGYCRINRDTTGGSLDSQVNHVQAALKNGETKVVLDNTYCNREARKSIIAFAQEQGLPIRCIWLDTSYEDAQFNACSRMVRKVGRLLEQQEYKKCKDPNLFPPAALSSYKKEFEPPTESEGFAEVVRVKFSRRKDPKYVNAALILDYDDTLRTSSGDFRFPCRSEDVVILPRRKQRIQNYLKGNKVELLLGISNQSGIGRGQVDLESVKKCFEHTNNLLGLRIDYLFCPHTPPPKTFCYCRKPAPGLGVLMIEKYLLDPARCLYVGDQTTDKTFARRCGFQYQHPNEFFA